MAKIFKGQREFQGEVGKGFEEFIDPREGLVIKVDGELRDIHLYRLKEGDGIVEILGFNAPEGREVYWHTSAHILAQAVKELFPGVKLGIGPATENGFYYDFYLGGGSFSEADLKKIEEKCREILEQNYPLERIEMNREEAIRIFKERKEDFKVELLQEMDDSVVSLYRQGDFVDLCRGPHLPTTGFVKAIKILSTSSSYWKGDERRQVMQRIYGIAFPSEEALEKFLEMQKEARKRDHRVLGPALDLFSIYPEEAGPGVVLWHPRGYIIRETIEEFWKAKHRRRGYQLVYTPHLLHGNLFMRSGHFSFYKENMFYFQKDDSPYVVKPMNCPAHILIFKSKKRSYRELPIRYAELGTVYRYERSGTLHGLLRVRGFTQDDAHIFCTPEQMEDEIYATIDLMEEILSAFDLKDFEIELSVRDPRKPEKYMGSNEQWQRAENALIKALERKGYSYKKMEGEAVFYGPKIDVKFKDSLGRKWQCTTIQVDFNLPERFNVNYVGPDGQEHRVVMIHRAIFGSLERFVGILVEHYGGAFPLWLAPVQVVVIPVSEKFLRYADWVRETLDMQGVRAKLDDRAERMQYKIAEAERLKVPYMVIVGQREEEKKRVSVRSRQKGEIGEMDLEEFIAFLKEEVENKK